MSKALKGKFGRGKAGSTVDSEIAWNALFTGILGLITLAVFIVIRPAFKRLYSSIFNYPDNRGLTFKGRREGRIGWMRTVWTASDAQLLGWAGLDAFLFLQVLRLLAIFGLLTGIPLLLVLPVVYKTSGPAEISTDSQYFSQSILHCRPAWLWLPALAAWYTTLVLFYLVYTFTRNYVILRQAYLKNPAALTGAALIRQLSNGSAEKGILLAGMHSKALLVDGISEKYDAATMKRLLDETPLGECERVAMITSGKDLVGIAEKRNETLKRLEKALEDFLNRAIASLSTKEGVEKGEMIKSLRVDGSGIDKELLLRLLSDREYLRESRPKNKKDGRDAISLHYEELVTLDKDLSLLLEEYQKLDGTGKTDTDDHGQESTSFGNVQIEQQEDKGIVKKGVRLLASLASIRRLSWVKHNLKDLPLATRKKARLAVVTMGDARKAAGLQRALLSRRPLSLFPEPAPSPPDIIWGNAKLARAERMSRWWAGLALMVLLNILFIPLFALLSSLADLDRLRMWAPGWLAAGIQRHPNWRTFWQGVIVPALMNLAMNAAPKLLFAIAKLQGRPSVTQTRAVVIDAYSAFLFFQSFVVTTISASILDILMQSTGSDGQRRGMLSSAFVVKALRITLPKQSVTFFNMFLQRLLLSLAMSFLRPVPLIKHIALRRLKRRSTPRTISALSRPSDWDGSKDFPEKTIFAFHVLSAFMLIAPVNIIVMTLFFVACLGLYRYALIYMMQSRYESGGLYWMRVARQFLIGHALGIVFLIVHFSLRRAVIPIILTIPLLAAAPWFTVFLEREFFRNRGMVVPMTAEDEEEVDALLNDLVAQQETMLTAQGEGASCECDTVPVSSLTGTREINDGVNQQAYENPVMLKALPTVMLDPLLCPCLRRLSIATE